MLNFVAKRRKKEENGRFIASVMHRFPEQGSGIFFALNATRRYFDLDFL